MFILLGCNSGGKGSAAARKDSSLKKDSSAPPQLSRVLSFLDSVSMQLKLSDDQMAKYTILDTFDYKISSKYSGIYPDSLFLEWGIWGDSAYNTRNLKVAILSYRDGNCSRKFLLVFDSSVQHNTSYMTIEDGCDRDGDDSPYSSQDYKILTDSTFQTMDTDDPGDEDENNRDITTTITKWKINDRGKIDSIRSKKILREPR